MKRKDVQTRSTVQSGTVLKRCTRTCSHAYQDKKYGSGIRVHNIMKNGGTRCTVCSTEEKN